MEVQQVTIDLLVKLAKDLPQPVPSRMKMHPALIDKLKNICVPVEGYDRSSFYGIEVIEDKSIVDSDGRPGYKFTYR